MSENVSVSGTSEVSPLDPSDLLDVKELSRRLRVKPSCINEWLRKRGTPNCIPCYKLGRHLRFLWSEVSLWILAQRNKKGRGGRSRSRTKKAAPQSTASVRSGGATSKAGAR